MIYLLDTHILIWLAAKPEKLNKDVENIITNYNNEIYFSVANIWEIAIKKALKKIEIDPEILRKGLFENGFKELAVKSEHVLNTLKLPNMHQDPFDRILVSQARVENHTLITADSKIIDSTDGYITILKN